MTILWITNLLLPEAYHILTKQDRKGSGGWLEASANEIVHVGDISLHIATASTLVKQIVEFKGATNIHYYVFPFVQNYNPVPYEPFMHRIMEEVAPDVVHIHGTEYPYGLAYINVAGPERVIVSMQGVMGRIAEHYTDGLGKWQILRHITLRDLRLKTILGEKKEYQKRAIVEKETIAKTKYIIGRTSFDKDYVMSVNSSCEYLTANESLRDSFYNQQWTYNNCSPHTIFLSQSNYPVKGLHQFLKAVPLIRTKYPDVKVRIAGEDITRHKTKDEIIKYSGYGSIIYHLINKLGLEDCFALTGLLSEREMAQEYLKSNVFVCPSTCENSSNSIAEAQILGVPCIASDRGGNPDMIPDSRYGCLFEFNDTEALADCVCRAFETASFYDNSEVRKMAKVRHNRATNLERTLSIYNLICKNNEI